jgi:hypothetical protein
LYGKSGLPTAVSGQNNEWFWGPGHPDATTVTAVELDGRLADLEETARTQAAGGEDPNALYRALASFTASYLAHLAVEEGEALPALWEYCSDDELLGIMTSFKASRSPLENLTSLVAQLPSANPAEVAHLVSVGIDPSEFSSLAQLLATTLDPDQLGALEIPSPSNDNLQPDLPATSSRSTHHN